MLVVRPCSTRAAYEGVLKRQLRLNLNECSKTLQEKGYEVIALTDYVMVAKKEYEFTIFPSGRVLVKDVDSIELAKMAMEKLFGDLGLHES
jgi:TATA-box binding protein (TBP) (component of TFIID and TFIIIB)